MANAALGWRGLLAALDVPPSLRKPVRIARVSGILFVVSLSGWLAVLSCALSWWGADSKHAMFIAAMAMGLFGTVHTVAVVTLRFRAARAVFARNCLGCGYTLVQGDLRSAVKPPRSAVCPECGRADDGAPLSPAVRDALPSRHAPIEGVDTPLVRFVAVITAFAGAGALISLWLLPRAGMTGTQAGGVEPPQLALGLCMVAFNATAVARTLCAMRAARKYPPA